MIIWRPFIVIISKKLLLLSIIFADYFNSINSIIFLYIHLIIIYLGGKPNKNIIIIIILILKKEEVNKKNILWSMEQIFFWIIQLKRITEV